MEYDIAKKLLRLVQEARDTAELHGPVSRTGATIDLESQVHHTVRHEICD
jgi:hypothetical protein